MNNNKKEFEQMLNEAIEAEIERLKSHKIIGAVEVEGVGEIFLLDIFKKDEDSKRIVVMSESNTDASGFEKIAEFIVYEDESSVDVKINELKLSVKGLGYLAKLIKEIKKYTEKNIINKGEK